MKILQTIYEFTSTDRTYGLYHVELDSGRDCYFLRNHDSVGVINHIFDEPANKCINIIRDDVKKRFLQFIDGVKDETD